MATVLAVPVLVILLVIQTAIFSYIPLLNGTADLVLVALLAWSIQKRVKTGLHWAVFAGLLVGYVSALPFGVYLAAYLGAVGIALALKQRIWQLPILAMLIATFFGTVLSHLIAIIVLRAMSSPIPFWDALNLVTLPSMLLNLALSVPFYVIFGELASYLYPEELEV